MSAGGNDVHSLPSLDLEETRIYYQNNLGFTIDLVDDGYLIASRETMSIKFYLTEDERLPLKTTCTICSEKIDLLYEEYVTRKILGLSKVNAYEMKAVREFFIKDPHENLLRFKIKPNLE
ncbi:MAG: hypothetical protein DHS20C07_26320 [Methyloligella sp.]|nr:MAG: hypothetical protein DHS20C07_26320 [Methyloligella sp.]